MQGGRAQQLGVRCRVWVPWSSDTANGHCENERQRRGPLSGRERINGRGRSNHIDAKVEARIRTLSSSILSRACGINRVGFIMIAHLHWL